MKPKIWTQCDTDKLKVQLGEEIERLSKPKKPKIGYLIREKEKLVARIAQIDKEIEKRNV